MASKVTTEFDIDLAKWQAKIGQIKADARAAELAAKQVKLGENLVSANAERELQKIAKLKEQIAAAGFEGALKELAPQQQLYALTQRIAQIKAAAVAGGPARESQMLAAEAQAMTLNERRVGILKQITAEKQRQVAAAQAEAQAAGRTAFIEQARGSGRQAMFSGYGSRGGAAGGAGLRGLGQAGLQVQDIAVQAQMGTNAIVIASQQIPQLLGSLGPIAAVGGAVVAVVGAFALMGYKSKEAFDQLITGAQAAKEEMGKLGRLGSLSEIGDGAQKAKDQVNELIAARSKLYSISGSTGAFFGQFFGGMSKADQLTQLSEGREEAEQRLAKLGDAAIDRSARDLQIQKLREKGLNYEADQKEREIAMEKELVAVRDKTYDLDPQKNAEKKARVMGNIEESYAIKEQIAWTAELKRRDQEVNAEREKRVGLMRAEASAADALRSQIRERGEERALQSQSPDQQAATLRTRAATLQRQGAAFDGEVTEAQKLRLQQQINGLLERADEIEQDESARTAKVASARAEWDLEQKIVEAKAAAAGKESAVVDALEDELKKLQLAKQYQDNFNVSAQKALTMASQRLTAENNIASALKAQQQQAATQQLATQAAITHAQASGHTRKAQRMQSEANVEERAKQIEADTGKSPEESRQIAEQMERDNNKINGIPNTIGRGRESPSANYENRFRGLDALKDRQGKDREVNAPNLREHYLNQPGRKDGTIAPNLGPQGQNFSSPIKQQLGGKNQQNAEAQARAANMVTLTEGTQIITLLTGIDQKLIVAN